MAVAAVAAAKERWLGQGLALEVVEMRTRIRTRIRTRTRASEGSELRLPMPVCRSLVEQTHCNHNRTNRQPHRLEWMNHIIFAL